MPWRRPIVKAGPTADRGRDVHYWAPPRTEPYVRFVGWPARKATFLTPFALAGSSTRDLRSAEEACISAHRQDSPEKLGIRALGLPSDNNDFEPATFDRSGEGQELESTSSRPTRWLP